MRLRQRWWTELILVVVVYVAYSFGRLFSIGDVHSAVDNGLSLLDIEKTLHLNAESPLNRLFTAHTAIGVSADFFYATLHYLVTPTVLIWLWLRRREHYRRLRTWLLGSTLIGLVGFIFMPTSPPRLLDSSYGFVDTMAQYATYGWWGSEASAPRGLGGLTNQYAAMPSLHVGWALWCAVVLWRHARSTPVRLLAVAYPLLTSVVVMGTANHYFLDAVAGVAVMGLGWLLMPYALRLTDAVRARLYRDRGDGGTGDGGAAAPPAEREVLHVPGHRPHPASPAAPPAASPTNGVGAEGPAPPGAGTGPPDTDHAPARRTARKAAH